MFEIIPSSDYWWRYFIYGGIFHFLALTPACKTDRHAEILRFFGYAFAVIPVFLHEGFLSAVWMLAFLYGLTLSLRYVKEIFAKWW